MDDKGEKKDPECALESEVNEWIRKKTIKGRLLNPRIDFKLNKMDIRENEHFLPRVNLGNGWYTDQSFRFRLNQFSKTDSWFPFTRTTETVKFFDLRSFNNDRMPSPKGHK